MYRASKLANETARAVNKLLALDPNCMDHFYTCPKKDVARPTHVPMELFELNQLLRSIVTSGKCINSRNALDATKLLSDSVLYIEGLKMSSDSPMKQYLPAVEMVAKGLDKMCKSLKNTDSMDAGNLGEVDPILVLVPGPVIDDSGVKNIIDSIRKFIKL